VSLQITFSAKVPALAEEQQDTRQQIQYHVHHPPTAQHTTQDFAFDLDLNPDL
jgi:hypothetical protein